MVATSASSAATRKKCPMTMMAVERHLPRIGGWQKSHNNSNQSRLTIQKDYKWIRCVLVAIVLLGCLADTAEGKKKFIKYLLRYTFGVM